MQNTKTNSIVTVNYSYLIKEIQKNIAFIKRVEKRQARRSVIDEVEETNKNAAIKNLCDCVNFIRAGLKKNNAINLIVNGEDWYDFIADGGFETMMKFNNYKIKN